MAERIVVASVQQRMHLPLTLDEYREDLRRFMRVAVAKKARLVVFPELGGMMVAPPILRDFRSQLLKRQDRGRRRRAPLWDRVVGGLAGLMGGMVGADFRRGLGALLDVGAQDVWRVYEEVFSGLAREYGVTLVAPSAYLPDPIDGVIRNMAVVFDSNGQVAGRQAKVVLHPADADLAQAGSTWDVISTDVGQIGLILGSDVMYPEVGRLLAYQGADMLVVQAACTEQLLFEKIRMGTLARMQDNQLFATISFLVGDNRLSHSQRTPFVGKSAIFAPQELSPRNNGVLVEMGNLRSEGVLAAEWDFAALRELWDTSETPVRRQLPLQQAGQMLAQLYARLQGLPKVMEVEQLAADVSVGDASVDQRASPKEVAPLQSLDDLAVISMVSSRWPLLSDTLRPPRDADDPIFDDDEDFVITPGEDAADVFATDDAVLLAGNRPNGAHSANRVDTHADEHGEKGDDETDEMDAVSGSDKGGTAAD